MSFERNILIAVAGTSPPVITETLFELVVKRNIEIHQIFILTTSQGDQAVREKLLNSGVIHRLYSDYPKPGFTLPGITPIIFKDNKGNPLKDVRTLEDNEIAAAQIIDFVRQQTEAPHTRLFCSLAGGRKTMSSYMGLAMNLFGREFDELSHVLVSPEEREKDPEFFYPAPGDTTTRIEMATIPFVRLRNKLEAFFGNLEQFSFADLIALSSMDMEKLEQSIRVKLLPNERTAQITWGPETRPRTISIRMEHKLFAIFEHIYQHKRPVQLANHPGLKKRYANFYRRDPGKGAFDQENITKNVSDLNHKFLKPNLPTALYDFLKIRSKKHISGVTLYYMELKR